MKKNIYSNLGLQCPTCWIGYGDKTDTWDTQEHRDKYHKGKQEKVLPSSKERERR